MKSAFLIALFLIFSSVMAQEESDFVYVKLLPKLGEGPFMMSFSRINPNQKGDHPFQAGYPDPLDYQGEMEGFEEYLLIPNGVQYSFLNFKKGLTEESSWNSVLGMYGKDASVVNEITDKDHRFFVRIAVKKITEEAMQIWVDQNANDLVEASEIYHYEKNPEDTWETGIARFPIIPVSYEDVINGEIGTIELPLQLAPFMSPGNILYAIKSFNQGVLDDGKGNLSEIFLSNSFTSSFYVNSNVKVFRAEEGEDWSASNVFDREFLEFGEAIVLGGEKYLIHDVNKWGTELVIRKLGENEEWIGTQKGAKAPAIVSKTLNEEPYDLYNGKVTLLDFWGSWCGPCVAEVPLLRDVFDFFESDQFELVGLVFAQRNSVEKFIDNNNVKWKQVMHTYEGDELDYSKIYNISAYPTTFLVGKDNSVLIKNEGLRGFQLYKTLCKHLNIPEQAFIDHIAQGQATLVFEVSDPKIGNVHLTGGKFDKQKHYAYKSGDHFVRGYHWEDGQVEEELNVVYFLNGKQETKALKLSKEQMQEGKIIITL